MAVELFLRFVVDKELSVRPQLIITFRVSPSGKSVALTTPAYYEDVYNYSINDFLSLLLYKVTEFVVGLENKRLGRKDGELRVTITGSDSKYVESFLRDLREHYSTSTENDVEYAVNIYNITCLLFLFEGLIKEYESILPPHPFDEPLRDLINKVQYFTLKHLLREFRDKDLFELIRLFFRLYEYIIGKGSGYIGEMVGRFYQVLEILEDSKLSLGNALNILEIVDNLTS